MVEDVLELIAEEFDVNLEDLTSETLFIEDLEADSIQLMELIMLLEEEYNLEIDEDTIVSMESVGDVIDYIESL